MFDNLKFWKKKDEYDFNLDLDSTSSTHSEKDPFFKDPTSFNPENTNSNPNPNTNLSNPFQSSPDSSSPFQMQSFQDKANLNSNGNNQVSSKDIELISSKLDTVKAMLENVIQRLDRIDRESHLEKPKIEQRRW